MLREATRMVGVVPNAAYRHFADRDELLAAVSTAAMHELAERMAAGVARVRGKHGDPGAARRRLSAIGTAYLAFAGEEPGLFATAFALPQQHAYNASEGAAGQGLTPLGHLRAASGRAGRRGRAAAPPPRRHRIPHLVHRARASSPHRARALRDVPNATRHHLEKLVGTFIEQALA